MFHNKPKKTTSASSPIEIRRATNGQFYVVYRDPGNFEPLAPSETMTTKQAVKKNIVAMARLFNGRIPRVVDYTLKAGPKEIIIKVK